MDPFFLLLIVLMGGGVIFMLYNIFFPGQSAAQAKEQESRVFDEERKNLRARIDALHADLAAAKKELEDRNKQTQGEVALVEQLKQENQELVKQKNMFQGKISDISEEVIRLRARNDELTAKAASSGEAGDLAQQLKNKDDQIQALSDKLKEEKEAMLKKEELMHKSIQDSESEVISVRQDLEEKKAQIQKYTAQISELSEQAKDSAQAEELKGKVRDYERQLEEMAKKNQVLEEKLKESSEDRGQKSEDRGQRSEDRRQRSEDRRKRKEDRRQKKEVRSPAEERRKRKEDRRRKIEHIRQEMGVSVAKAEMILGLNPRQEEILKHLKDNKKITRQEYADRFDVSVATASRDLKELQGKKLIDSYGPSGPGRCFVLIKAKN